MGGRWAGPDAEPVGDVAWSGEREWRIAVLSDPHGDLLALQKVIEDLESAKPVDEVLVAGDLAQGGPQPADVVDLIRERNWSSVRGNSDDLLVRLADGLSLEEALGPGRAAHEDLPESLGAHALWSVGRLGRDRMEYLRSLPPSVVREGFPLGRLVLVHATPWSNEDVVLPDAEEAVAERMIAQADARIVLYGHIHTQYLRRVGQGALVSVGAISGSNDADPRPAYTVVSFGESITIEPRRVDWPLQEQERRAAHDAAGILQYFRPREPGTFPVRLRPGEPITAWP